MPTRQDFQIAQDIIKFVNIMNDIMDCNSWILQDKDPQTGGIFQTPHAQDATLDDLKDASQRCCQNIAGYQNMIDEFLNRVDRKVVEDALLVLGISLSDIEADMANMATECDYLTANVKNVKSKAELVPIAEHINTNIPKLTLVRRSWCLGL